MIFHHQSLATWEKKNISCNLPFISYFSLFHPKFLHNLYFCMPLLSDRRHIFEKKTDQNSNLESIEYTLQCELKSLWFCNTLQHISVSNNDGWERTLYGRLFPSSKQWNAPAWNDGYIFFFLLPHTHFSPHTGHPCPLLYPEFISEALGGWCVRLVRAFGSFPPRVLCDVTATRTFRF